jgi:hypothetical protein
VSEFGCDKWRLEGVNEKVVLFKCAQTDANIHCSGIILKSNFDAAERKRIAEEAMGCDACEFKPRLIGKAAVDNCYECPSYHIQEGHVVDCGTPRCPHSNIGPYEPRPLSSLPLKKVAGRLLHKSPYEPSQTVDLGSKKMTIARRIPSSSPYDASRR